MAQWCRLKGPASQRSNARPEDLSVSWRASCGCPHCFLLSLNSIHSLFQLFKPSRNRNSVLVRQAKNPKQTSFWKSVFQLSSLQQRQKDLIKFKCWREGMFCHVSDSTLAKSSCRKVVIKTYWPFLAIEEFSETSLKVKWHPARTWDFTRGTLSDFYVMVVYPNPSILQQDGLQLTSM